jgi:hypothetical protein
MSDPHAEAKIVERGQAVVTVRSGRQFAITVPTDATTVDILDLVSYISTNLERELQQAKSGSRIVVASSSRHRRC